MKQLRTYQTNAVTAAINGTGLSAKKCLLVLATGLGKTVIATKVAEHFKKTLFIVDREELLEQAALSFIYEKYDDPELIKTIKNIGFFNFIRQKNKIKVGCIKADVFDINGDVVIASGQTLYRRLDRLKKTEFDLVIVDEAHKFMAKTLFTGVDYFTPRLRLGLTATPHRQDNLPLGDLFDSIDFEYNIKEGIRDGYLVELDGIRIKTSVSLDKVRTTGGELNSGDLSNEINTLARNNLIADSYLKYANGRKTIGFCCNIQHALDLTEAFINKGIKATAVSSNEEQTGDRTKKVRDFKEGKYDVIFNVDILTTGFDQPAVSCIIQASPTKSLTRYMQATGRCTRPLPGTIDGLETTEERWAAIKKSDKKDSLIIDIVDNTTRHNIVNTWTLDKQLPPDERVFITQEKRDKLNEARENKPVFLKHQQKEDERVNLLKIPRVKLSRSIKMQDPATEAQLKWIYDLGYPKDAHYTKQMCVEIINQLPATPKQVMMAKALGYDVASKTVLTRGDINAIIKDVDDRKKKNEEEERRKKVIAKYKGNQEIF